MELVEDTCRSREEETVVVVMMSMNIQELVRNSVVLVVDGRRYNPLVAAETGLVNSSTRSSVVEDLV